ncbi:MAG: barstar family protein [Caldilinea sp.]|nr:barstar family protein [Anaerolineales bacterium]
MNELDQRLAGETAGGMHRWLSPQKPPAVKRYVEVQGWRFFYLDGRRARDKASFLQTAADVMAFPAYFGHNWDAFEESINDLAWAPASGYVLLYDHVWWFACTHPADWQVAREILQAACERWASQNRPFVVFLRHTHGCSGVADLLVAPRPHQRALRARLW